MSVISNDEAPSVTNIHYPHSKSDSVIARPLSPVLGLFGHKKNNSLGLKRSTEEDMQRASFPTPSQSNLQANESKAVDEEQSQVIHTENDEEHAKKELDTVNDEIPSSDTHLILPTSVPQPETKIEATQSKNLKQS